ncbi:MAG: HAMP domain-containing sensor histidine kinase [Longibaculum muris]|uniref:sensor histidine kinase n=1 Tax=Longibaculum muris TaxID=1796628 RepID=UPI0007936CF0|nr:HAMP domain-containing sensor histidine kinase [Longibaculum muris]KXU52358.1 ATPase/histidine kinase/DNA gyrase B/HSP90 domain protein [Candidatus Stoquefichus sp. KLE1796]MBS5369824.1 HAMP domain-containing histidine kinase [Coprobacillus cateniformis]MED9810885.1 HAMP domain-containing sensor histidine kinase [Longibaculum muris]
MKKLNFSLIIKVTGVVFIAFSIVLGNEIRLGINRYTKNTLDTDAEAIVRNLDKFAKSYTQSIAINKVNLNSTEFKNIYRDALAGDGTKVKCLVNAKGQILDVSREGEGFPSIGVIVSKYKGATNWPVYFDLSSMDSTSLMKIESELLKHKDEKNTITLKIVTNSQSELNSNIFDNIFIKELKLNNQIIYVSNTKGKVQTMEGTVGSYASYNLEIAFPSTLTESKKQSTNTSGKKSRTMILDYQNAMNGLREQITKNFKTFKKSGRELTTTNYSIYKILNPYEYNGKYYSTVMLRLEDWGLMNGEDTTVDYTDEASLDKVTAGYIFVIQEYTNLTMRSFRQFMHDNSSTYLLAFVLIILICLSIAYMVIKPIRRIETTAKHIARKEFDYPIDTTRHDELGDLSRSIDRMSKELESTINNLHQEIERVQRLEVIRKEFVSNFTHEIKTPLGIINGFSELVEIEQDEKKRNEYITIIQNETKRINELVLAMLDLSKLESQKVSLKLEEVDLLDIVGDCLDSMMYLFERKQIKVHTQLDSSMVKADRFKIEMVIDNFISNALRYTAEGKNVYVRLDEHGFEIENEGHPIPKDDLEKIWLTFHKVDRSRNAEGTGLGLAICKAILDLHHFEYGVKNTEKGVLFYFKY